MLTCHLRKQEVVKKAGHQKRHKLLNCAQGVHSLTFADDSSTPILTLQLFPRHNHKAGSLYWTSPIMQERECTGVARQQGKGQQQTTAKTTHLRQESKLQKLSWRHQRRQQGTCVRQGKNRIGEWGWIQWLEEYKAEKYSNWESQHKTI